MSHTQVPPKKPAKHELLCHLLNQPSSWNDDGTPRLEDLELALMKVDELIFIELVYEPLLLKVQSKIKAFCNDDVDVEEIAPEILDHWIDHYWRQWHEHEWFDSMIDLGQVEATGIRPRLVYDREEKDGTQLSMF
jgi:hypothetical protein